MNSVRKLWKRGAYELTRRSAASLGKDLVPAGLWGPVPDLPRSGSPTSAWDLRLSMAGIDWNLGRQLAFVRTELSGHLHDFDPAAQARGTKYPLDYAYTWYERAEAELLHAFIRWAKPRRMFELGSGFSTLVSAAACAINASEGHPCEFVAIDPAPRVALPSLAGLTALERRPVQELPVGRFSALREGDILFIDTTHVVKRGSEVIHLLLEVLPRLAPGVIVHFHDIFLPFDYPRRWYERGMFPNEQWMVHAYLAENRGFEVLVATFALARLATTPFAEMIPSVRDAQPGPSAFWLRRVEAA